jgi:alpha-galactosidase
MRCSITFFNEPSLPASEYEATIRLDKRPLPFQECIRQVGVWWEQLPAGRPPLPVPEHARLPVYSTWYAYHKDLTDHQLERECQAAKRLGCDVLIVDDGWHDDLDRRTYSTCGDWETAGRFPDMGAFSDGVHNMGMKLLLWYALPFVGSDSHAWNKFQGKFLSVKSEVAVLDPRYPECAAT